MIDEITYKIRAECAAVVKQVTGKTMEIVDNYRSGQVLYESLL